MTDQNPPKQKTEDTAPANSGNLPDPEYKVGPGRPPAEHRFKKGGPSPNPKGRPRKDATALPDVKKIFEEALNKKYKFKRGDKDVFLTRTALGIDQLLNQFAKGDRYARRDMIEMAVKFGVDLLAGQKGRIEEALSLSHEAILEGYFARRPRPEATPQNRVMAPPELLDGIDTPEKTTRKVNRLSPPKPAADPK
jgi:Family of unknown function (DUF5681)